MSENNKAIARRFVEEILNEGKLDEAKNFIANNIVYHGAEEIRGLEEFKEWISEDLKALPDAHFTIVDEMEEQNKVAIRWTLKATQEGELHGLPASHKKFETNGVDIFHFEAGKIKEAWTIFDALTPALELGVVEIVQLEK